ncbi:MAG TPA: NADH-quinone oxidoreductase subunit L [Acidimicrobiales bacterium]|nr:NADH-quinone oxidoreductase subunit L [Acidimicrobiales bacterium]
MLRSVFLIPLLPLAGFVILLATGRRLGNPRAGWLATLMVAASFVVTIVVFVGLFRLPVTGRSYTQTWFTWISAGHLHVDMGLLVDPLSMTMAAFVTGVSALIHLYSIGYMEHDEDFSKFFVYLNLFVAAMLLLVLADNFLLLFLGWEGVGVCSYFLIGFWFERDSAASAAKKAVIFNRIGDAAFLVALFLIYERTGSLEYHTVFARLGSLGQPSLVAIGLLLFAGAVGKSAQIPLYPWLADAMEGPTPVSALIHAATMVTAGVYLMCRISPILFRAPDAGHVIAVIGAVTALLGATIACAQNDIKKILAYSTISQLGYMFFAAGIGAYDAAIFLMLTHAFYKALLFLGAGSVIHAMNDDQDVKTMGALARFMPITAVTFLIGWLSIGGVPPFSGFWSKGDVLLNGFASNPALWVVGAVTAVLTAYYLGRAYLLVFRGEQRWVEARVPGDGHGHDGYHPHDPSWVMSAPLVVLGVLSVLGGLINLPVHGSLDFLDRWLSPVFGSRLFQHHWSVGGEWTFALIDAALAVLGVGLSITLWGKTSERPAVEPTFLRRAWYIDWAYDRFIARPSTEVAIETSSVVEAEVIDGAVNGVAGLVRSTGRQLRKVQTGYVRNYALGLTAGLVLVLAYVLTRVS